MPFYTYIAIFYKKYGIFREKNVILKSNRVAIKKEKNINNAETIYFCNKYKEQNLFKMQIYICVEIFKNISQKLAE